ncbi:MAG: hypothetical protein JJU40_16660 [Rhodobacteraceae bacterium]|nr:hypothetical protein [Paracoccaceae bacterium]
MAIKIDSTLIDACKTDDLIVPEFFPEYPRPNKSQDLRHACAAAGIPIDFVYRVIESLDEHAGRRELGDLVAAIDDAGSPLSVIEMMIDHDLIRFMPGHAFDAALPVERVT